MLRSCLEVQGVVPPQINLSKKKVYGCLDAAGAPRVVWMQLGVVVDARDANFEHVHQCWRASINPMNPEGSLN